MAQEPRPIVSIEINPQLRLICASHLSPRKYATLMRSIDEACMHGDVTFLAQFPFLRKPVFAKIGRVAIPASVRRAVWERDGGHCVDCKGTTSLQLDHVVAVVHGGHTCVGNLALRCRTCNRQKGPQSHERRRMAVAHG